MTKANFDKIKIEELKRELKTLSYPLVCDALLLELMKATRNPKFEKVNGCTFAKIFLDSFATKYGVGLDKLLEQVGKEELTNETINRINQEEVDW